MSDEAWCVLVCMGKVQGMGMHGHLVCFDKVKQTYGRCVNRR